MESSFHCYWFILGREPLLSAAEILQKIPSAKISSYNAFILRLNASFNVKKLIMELGGTIKVGRELASGLTADDLAGAMLNELESVSGKIHFGISFYGGAPAVVETMGKELKKLLRQKGRSARYVFKKEAALSSVTVEANDLLDRGREFLIFNKDDKYFLAVTEAVQPFSAFSERDFGRPGRDAKSGMLPPKLALMLLNLAGLKSDEVLLDPFCGSGTILTEGLLAGLNKVLGSDISDKAVKDSRENIIWTKKKFDKSGGEAVVFASDSGTLGSKIAPQSIDAIVSEPYLGKPLRGHESALELGRSADELFDLYYRSFKEFKKILRPGARIIFVIPQFSGGASLSELLVPALEIIGFKVWPLLPADLRRESYVLYRRPDQRVGREIWRFRI